MAATSYKMTLSTTDYNLVGDIKVRQADDETQVFEVSIIENGLIKSFNGLTPFFCLMAREITGQGVSEERVGTFDGAKGTLKYTLSANALQMVGRNEAYFSFRKESSSGRWVEQFSTKSFFYTVEKSIYTQPFKDSNYWFTFNELYQKFLNYQENGKTSWEDFVEQNKEILESVDPSGRVLNELIGARGMYPNLAERVELLDKKQDYSDNARNADTPLIIPTYDGGGEAVHPKVLYFANKFANYNYWMAYTPYPKTNDDYENPCIVVSTDGVQWIDLAGLTNPIDQPTAEQISDGMHMSDTHLVYNDKTNLLECWYRLNKNGSIEQILRKTSSDGKTWSAREKVYGNDDGYMVLSPAIRYETNKYKMWFVNPSDGIMYTESSDGKFGNWSNPIKIALVYAIGETKFQPWHLDVEYFQNKYYFLINAINGSSRLLQVGESDDGINVKNIRTILKPRPKSMNTVFDNNEIYRSALCVVGDSVRLYYSCHGVSGWKIAVLTGENPYTVNKFDVRRDNAGTLVNMESILLGKNKTIYTQENKGSYLTSQILKFLISGVAGAAISVGTDGAIKILQDNGNLGTLSALNVYSTNGKFNNVEGLSQDAVVFKEVKIQRPNGTKPKLQLTELSNTEAYITLGSQEFTIKIQRPDGSASLLETGGLLINAYNVPNVEGAIRYNANLKKHQGYDGTAWQNLY